MQKCWPLRESMNESSVAERLIALFNQGYGKAHFPITVGICVFGVVSNLLNIVILQRQRYQQVVATTNILLLSLAFCQLCLVCNFLVTTLTMRYLPECSSKSLITYLLVNINFNIIFHTIAVFHVAYLAIIRYIVICRAGQKRYVHLPAQLVKRITVALYAITPLICIPFYFNSAVYLLQNGHDHTNHRISDLNVSKSAANDSDCYELAFSSIAKRSGLLTFNLWFFGVVGKLLPCAIIVVLSLLLIFRLRSEDERKSRLLQRARKSSIQRYTAVSNVMLLVTCLFFLVEFPMAVLNFLSAVIGKQFRDRVYLPLADFFEMLTLLYSSVNFVLYCIMSSQFRLAFRQLVCPCIWKECDFDDVFSSRRASENSQASKRGSTNTTAPFTKSTVVFSELPIFSRTSIN